MNTVRFALDHLWQSTIVVAIVALAAFALRHRRAGLRYALWLGASVKFLVPFAALSAIGAAIGSRLAVHTPAPAPALVTTVVAAPFVDYAAHIAAASTRSAAPPTALPVVLMVIWAAGCLFVAALWIVRWRRAARIVRAAESVEAGREVEILRRLEQSAGLRCQTAVRVSDAAIEPGVFGVARPTLVWPRAMSAHLTDAQIEAILLHELIHVRRRDNLTALVQGAAQAVCWFHPIVWWMSARLMDERERACDEAVVAAGGDRQIYAESLLKTCQFCVGAPMTTMAGVMGSDLKRRVTGIMTTPPRPRLGRAARVAIAAAIVTAIAIPVVGGAASATQSTATLAMPDPSKTFDSASVRQNTSGDRVAGTRLDAGRVTVRNLSLKMMLMSAFSIREVQLVGGADWLANDRFDLVAKSDRSHDDLNVMLQNLLIERFAMKVHVETRNMPIYALVLARTDGTLGPDLVPMEGPSTESGSGRGGPVSSSASRSGGGGGMMIDRSGGSGGGAMMVGARAGAGPPGASMSGGGTMANIANMLIGAAGRFVVDRTGVEGRFKMKLRYSSASAPAGDDPNRAPDLFTAVQEQLGLKLEATRGPVDVLVIESAEHPKNDDFETPDMSSGQPPPPPAH